MYKIKSYNNYPYRYNVHRKLTLYYISSLSIWLELNIELRVIYKRKSKLCIN